MNVNKTDILTELPISDLELEKDVLALMLKATRIEDYIHKLNEKDFYNLLHKRTYKEMSTLYDKNGSCTYIDLPIALKTKAEISNLFTRDNVMFSLADHYIEKLKQVTAKRELQYLSNKINVMVKENKDVFDIKSEIDNKLEEVSQYGVAIMSSQNSAIEEEFMATLGQKANPIHTGFKNLDYIIGGMFPGYFVLIGGIPGVGKSTLLLNIMNNVCKQNKKVLFVSLEMPYTETHAKLISLNSGIPLSVIRGVELSEDYGEIFNGVASITNYKLYRMGARGSSVYDVEQEMRRLGGVDIVFIDYLQRLIPSNRNATRYEQVSCMSRDIKMLANKYKIPIVCIASINRGYEQRSDHRPRLADFRDCLSVGTKCLLSNGISLPIEEIKQGMELITLGKQFSLSFGKVKNIWNTGSKQTFEITTKSGRKITATGNHRFLVHKDRGSLERAWMELKNIKMGWKIVIPQRYPDMGEDTINGDRALLLGWLLGDGHLGGTAELIVQTEEEAKFAVDLAKNNFDINPIYSKDKRGKNSYRVHFGNAENGSTANPLTKWLREIGVWGITGKDKFIPNIVFEQANKNIGYFLKGLFHADGSISKTKSNSLRIKFDSISPLLAGGAQHLLLRMGLASTISKSSMKKSGYRSENSIINTVTMTGYERIITFADKIGFILQKQEKLLSLIKSINKISLKRVRSGAIIWEKIRHIKEIGFKDTYDIQMEGSPYFCANDFLTHNSGNIEYDIDLGLLLYRPAMFPTSGMSNEEYVKQFDNCEVIVAKNRYGATGDVLPFVFHARESKFSEG